ncbi:MAG TPA: hypothetical protein VKD71_07180 [Gemmataceae bacterium]|nr:hypothetical protein [Gemmataceae bacterium]
MIGTLVLTLLLQAPNPKEEPLALYVIEAPGGLGTKDAQSIIRLSFDRENKLANEIILTKKSALVFESGGHQIVAGRFMVIRGGCIVDLKSRKVLNEESEGHVLGVEDGKVVYRVDHESRTKELFAFDVRTHELHTITAGTHWDLPGEKSPDKSMSVSSHEDGDIRLHQLGQATRIIAEKCSSELLPGRARMDPNWLPCLWLDGKRILTIQSNQKLVTLTIDGVMDNLVKIEEMPKTLCFPPGLWRDEKGRVIYSGYHPERHWKHFLIELGAKTASPLSKLPLGHGFEASVSEDKKRRREVYHNGKVVGQWVFDEFGTCTAPGLIAFEYAEVKDGKSVGETDGVAVWSERLRDWRTIKMRVGSVVGWAK